MSDSDLIDVDSDIFSSDEDAEPGSHTINRQSHNEEDEVLENDMSKLENISRHITFSRSVTPPSKPSGRSNHRKSSTMARNTENPETNTRLKRITSPNRISPKPTPSKKRIIPTRLPNIPQNHTQSVPSPPSSSGCSIQSPQLTLHERMRIARSAKSARRKQTSDLDEGPTEVVPSNRPMKRRRFQRIASSRNTPANTVPKSPTVEPSSQRNTQPPEQQLQPQPTTRIPTPAQTPSPGISPSRTAPTRALTPFASSRLRNKRAQNASPTPHVEHTGQIAIPTSNLPPIPPANSALPTQNGVTRPAPSDTTQHGSIDPRLALLRVRLQEEQGRMWTAQKIHFANFIDSFPFVDHWQRGCVDAVIGEFVKRQMENVQHVVKQFAEIIKRNENGD